MKHHFLSIISMSCILVFMLSSACYKDAISPSVSSSNNCSTCSYNVQTKDVDLTIDNWIDEGQGEFKSDLYSALKKHEYYFMSIGRVVMIDGVSRIPLTNGQPVPIALGSLTWIGRNLTLISGPNSGQVSNYPLKLSISIYYSNNQ